MVKLFTKVVLSFKEKLVKEQADKLAKAAQIALIKGEQGLDQHYIHGPEAEAASKLADAANKLIFALHDIDEAVIRCGPILLVKVTKDGKAKLAVQTISTRLRHILDENPQLLKSPELLFAELEKLKSPIREL